MGLKLRKDLKNIRYVGQRDGFSCGPIAVLNILKWAGYDVTSKYLPKLKKYCKTDEDGTRTEIISKVLDRYSLIKYECVPFVKIDKLHKHICNGGSAILEISWFDKKKNTTTGHFYTIIGCLKYKNIVSYDVINWETGTTRKYASRRDIVREFRRCIKSEDNPKAWLISRK